MVAALHVATLSGATATPTIRSNSSDARRHDRGFANDFNGILPSHVNIVSTSRRSVAHESNYTL